MSVLSLLDSPAPSYGGGFGSPFPAVDLGAAAFYLPGLGDGGPDPFLPPNAQEPEYDFLTEEFVNPAGPAPTVQEAAAAVQASQEKPKAIVPKAKKAVKKAKTPKQAPKAKVPDAPRKVVAYDASVKLFNELVAKLNAHKAELSAIINTRPPHKTGASAEWRRKTNEKADEIMSIEKRLRELSDAMFIQAYGE